MCLDTVRAYMPTAHAAGAGEVTSGVPSVSELEKRARLV